MVKDQPAFGFESFGTPVSLKTQAKIESDQLRTELAGLNTAAEGNPSISPLVEQIAPKYERKIQIIERGLEIEREINRLLIAQVREKADVDYEPIKQEATKLAAERETLNREIDQIKTLINATISSQGKEGEVPQ